MQLKERPGEHHFRKGESHWLVICKLVEITQCLQSAALTASPFLEEMVRALEKVPRLVRKIYIHTVREQKACGMSQAQVRPRGAGRRHRKEGV